MEGDALIQEAQGVPHGTVRGLGDVAQGLLLHPHLLLPGQVLHPGSDGVYGDALEIVSLAPGENRNGQFVHFRGSQDENHIGGRLLQGLQQRIESARRQHMHLVDDIDFVFPFCGGIRYFIYDFPYIIHAVVGGGVDFYHVHAGPGGDGTADAALPAGAIRPGILAVHRPGKDFRHSGLAGAPGPGEQIGVPDAVRLQLVLQRGHDMLLTLYIREGVRAEFSV